MTPSSKVAIAIALWRDGPSEPHQITPQRLHIGRHVGPAGNGRRLQIIDPKV